MLLILNFLWDETTGLPVSLYTEKDVRTRAEEIYRHVHHAYPTLPSPYYEQAAVV